MTRSSFRSRFFIHFTARCTDRRWYWFHRLKASAIIQLSIIDWLYIGSRYCIQKVQFKLQTSKEITSLQIQNSSCQFSFPFAEWFISMIKFLTFVFISSYMQIARYCFPQRRLNVINEPQFICVAMASYLHINKSGKRFDNHWIPCCA